MNNASLEALHGVRGHKEANWANWAGKSMNHQRGPAACTSKNIYYYDIHALIAFALGGHICHRDTCLGIWGLLISCAINCFAAVQLAKPATMDPLEKENDRKRVRIQRSCFVCRQKKTKACMKSPRQVQTTDRNGNFLTAVW